MVQYRTIKQEKSLVFLIFFIFKTRKSVIMHIFNNFLLFYTGGVL